MSGAFTQWQLMIMSVTSQGRAIAKGVAIADAASDDDVGRQQSGSRYEDEPFSWLDARKSLVKQIIFYI